MSDVTVIREIDPSARIAPDAVIGPYCVIGPHVTIGPGTVLDRRVVVAGHTMIGSGNFISEGCVLGVIPQDLKYAGGITFLSIGHRNRLGRCVTMHIGTENGGYLTRIGNDNLVLESCHVGHDCYVDDRVTLGKCVLLAGHIRVHNGAVIEDMVGALQFVTIGQYARVGRRTPIRRDVPPYCLFVSQGSESTPAVRGINEPGLAAADLDQHQERELRHALNELFSDESALQTKIEQLMNLGVEGEVAHLCEFCTRSLKGTFGRHREMYRGRIPPELDQFLPAEWRPLVRRAMP